MSKRLLLWAVTCALGCGGGSSREIWCSAECAAQDRCQVGALGSVCVESCAAGWQGLDYSAAGANALAPCLSALPCAALLDDGAWQTAYDACWTEAKRDVEVTPRVRGFCTEFSRVWFECGGWFSSEDCERTYALWSDEVLDGLAACGKQTACAVVLACVDGVFAR